MMMICARKVAHDYWKPGTGHFGTVRSRDDATTRSRGRGCQRDDTHRGRHLRREIDSTARAWGEGSAL